MNIRFDEYIKWGLSAAATRFNLKLFSLNLEVTKRCNAHCNFCDYWKTTNEDAIKDFTPIVQKLDPLSLVITGGEPLLRDDLVEIIRTIKRIKPLQALAPERDPDNRKCCISSDNSREMGSHSRSCY